MTFSIKNIFTSKFIGQQLSRLRMGQSYYSLLIASINAVMLVKIAYPTIELNYILVFVPFLLLCTVFVGYFLDHHNINSLDTLKSNEMAHRFLNTGDLKNQEFQLLQTKILIEALNSIKDGKKLEFLEIEEKYNNYVKKWKSP
ncbi:hypothetical protein DSAG12_00170 [Promethearchaeum syntrophicum]|uniref:Uncharacterized protein n=1 Tax=Promethearchaeum syntrophicum TaxID=2594042 RepID=A0A5B9D6D6_9ARCH|nr:hypothetical protein [Candidatus Prometheoarchaeum syntrophicum]QEE14357.1 hypothetical protein DSAG12_00170 [Candidatus Prometheoarchaeum syntrophicum]